MSMSFARKLAAGILCVCLTFAAGCGGEDVNDSSPVPGDAAAPAQPLAPAQDASAAVGDVNSAIQQQQKQIDDMQAE